MSKEYISFKEYTILMNRIGQWLRGNNKTFNRRDVYGYFGRVADKGTIEKVLKERYNRNEFVDDSLTAEYTECAIHDNQDLSFLPAYVTGTDGTKYYLDAYVDMANRVSAYEVLNGTSPNIVYLKKENTTSQTSGTVTKMFKDAFGDFGNTIDGALTKIQGRGYGYYYDDKYCTQSTINAMKNRNGVNCTDATQVFYRLAIELGYTAQIIHVKCRGGDGHVRLKLSKNGSTFYRDPASVLDGGSISSNWCMDGTTLAVNPGWVFSQMYC